MSTRHHRHSVNALLLGLGLVMGFSMKGQTLIAGTLTWTGNTGSNWFESANWSPSDRVPEAGDTIIIPNTVNGVLLTNSTPELASLTITDNSLTFDGWDTILQATTVTIGVGGNLTHNPNTDTSGTPGDYESWTPDNRVYIECTDLTLHTNATINADFQGYRAPPVGDNSVWGNGPGGGYARCGGSYGAQSAQGSSGNPGTPYGSLYAPIDPGSAGSGQAQQDTAGHGGGAVRIDASGTVTIFGTISVNGAAGQFRSAGGAGGSIYITCVQFAGSPNGLLRANGANGASGNYGSGGSGGRIAVWVGVPPQILDIFQTAGQHPFVEADASHDDYHGDILVDPGSYGWDTVNESDYEDQAHPGTKVFMRWTALSGTLFLFR